MVNSSDTLLRSHTLSISELSRCFRDGVFSVIDVVNHHLQRINDSAFGAYITVFDDYARHLAQESQSRIDSGNARPLEGIPIAIKDLFCMKGFRTTAGSRMLENFVSPYESTVTQRLLAAGAIPLGKTLMDEFAMGSANTYTELGKCLNPWDITKIPGGSSGGSAVAVAAGLAYGSTGSDTGGSIRQPAAHTGIVGVRPTYGRVSRYGMMPLAQSLDQAGVMAKYVSDAAILLRTIAGYDELDPTSSDMSVDDYVSFCSSSLKGKRIGFPVECFSVNLCEDLVESVKKIKSHLRSIGAECIDVHLPNLHHSLAVYRVLACAEAASSMARYDGVRYGYRAAASDIDSMYQETRTYGFGDEVRRRILLGAYVLSSKNYDMYYLQALKVRTMIMNDFTKAFQGVDTIIMPVTSAPAPSYEEVSDPELMYYQDLFTLPINIACIGGIAVPVGLSNGLPISLQVVHGEFMESKAFAVAAEIERFINFRHWVLK